MTLLPLVPMAHRPHTPRMAKTWNGDVASVYGTCRVEHRMKWAHNRYRHGCRARLRVVPVHSQASDCVFASELKLVAETRA